VAIIPTIPVFSDGPPAVNASQLNALGQALNFQLFTRPFARYRQSAAGVTFVNAVWATMVYDVTDLDTDSGRTGTGSATDRYVARTTGWYNITAMIAFQANATGSRFIRMVVNGGIPATGIVAQAACPSPDISSPVLSHRLHMNVGDYLQIQGFQNSGTSLNTFGSNEIASLVDLAFDLAG
jgi:hypothetical protein